MDFWFHDAFGDFLLCGCDARIDLEIDPEPETTEVTLVNGTISDEIRCAPCAARERGSAT